MLAESSESPKVISFMLPYLLVCGRSIELIELVAYFLMLDVGSDLIKPHYFSFLYTKLCLRYL